MNKLRFRDNVCNFRTEVRRPNWHIRVQASCTSGDANGVRGPKLIAAFVLGDAAFDTCTTRLLDRDDDGVYVGSCDVRYPR